MVAPRENELRQMQQAMQQQQQAAQQLQQAAAAATAAASQLKQALQQQQQCYKAMCKEEPKQVRGESKAPKNAKIVKGPKGRK